MFLFCLLSKLVLDPLPREVRQNCKHFARYLLLFFFYFVYYFI